VIDNIPIKATRITILFLFIAGGGRLSCADDVNMSPVSGNPSFLPSLLQQFVV
jgi:hypothetical protein